jgi:cytochrome P450
MPISPIELDQEFYQDPHALYHRLAAEGPARFVRTPDGRRGWLVTSYDDGRALLNDSRLSKDIWKLREAYPPSEVGALAASLNENMLFTDPPDHTRLRHLVNRVFTGRAVERLRPRIERATDDLLDALSVAASSGGGVVDLVEGFALPLPITVICELLGVPAADRDDFREWTLRFVTVSSPERIADANRRMSEYLTDLISEKTARPGEDLLSGLAQIPAEEGGLSPRELLSMAQILLIAGFETTVNLIANGVLALVRNPDQLTLLRSDPSLLPDAVEEFLRYDGPLTVATQRVTTEPVRVGDVEIPAGQLVLISLLAANRDGDRFTDPDRFDITRRSGGHIAFGHGIHHCVGAPLARLEGQIAIGRLLSRFSELALEGDSAALRWRASTLMHGLYSLPLRVLPPTDC